MKTTYISYNTYAQIILQTTNHWTYCSQDDSLTQPAHCRCVLWLHQTTGNIQHWSVQQFRWVESLQYS